MDTEGTAAESAVLLLVKNIFGHAETSDDAFNYYLDYASVCNPNYPSDNVKDSAVLRYECGERARRASCKSASFNLGMKSGIMKQ